MGVTELQLCLLSAFALIHYLVPHPLPQLECMIFEGQDHFVLVFGFGLFSQNDAFIKHPTGTRKSGPTTMSVMHKMLSN